MWVWCRDLVDSDFGALMNLEFRRVDECDFGAEICNMILGFSDTMMENQREIQTYIETEIILQGTSRHRIQEVVRGGCRKNRPLLAYPKYSGPYDVRDPS